MGPAGAATCQARTGGGGEQGLNGWGPGTGEGEGAGNRIAAKYQKGGWAAFAREEGGGEGCSDACVCEGAMVRLRAAGAWRTRIASSLGGASGRIAVEGAEMAGRADALLLWVWLHWSSAACPTSRPCLAAAARAFGHPGGCT